MTCRILPALVIALSLLAAACGSDDDTNTATSESSGSSDSESTAEDDKPDDGGDRPPQCVDTPYEVEIHAAGKGARESFTVVDTAIEESAPGKDAGIYLTSWELDPDAGVFGQLMEPPAGSKHVSVGVGYFSSGGASADDFDEIEAGDALINFSDAGDTESPGLLLQIIGDDGPLSDFNTGPVVDGEVLYWGEEGICLDVEYTTQSGIELVGIVSATR